MGGVFVFASAFKGFILKQDMATSICLNISVQDCGFYSKIKNIYINNDA